MQEDVTERSAGRQRAAVEGHPVTVRVDLGGQPDDRQAVDGDAAGIDQLLTLAA
jgi:hypothetical protein